MPSNPKTATPTYVPILISVVSLLVSLLTLLKGFFDSAEGYKKCSEAVIGPWSKLRWRRWSWSEFRYETHFVTPKLHLQNISRPRVEQDAYKMRYLSLRERVPKRRGRRAGSRPDGHKGHRPRYWRFLPWHWTIFSSAKHADALFQSEDVLDESLMPDFDIPEKPNANKPEVVIDGGELGDMANVGLHFLSEQRVSWVPFLRHLHGVHGTGPDGKEPLVPAVLDSQEYLVDEHRGEIWPDPWRGLAEERGVKQASNIQGLRYETGVSVSLIEWTWDSLPAKATKPMASTNLGTLVVMAMRLGMRWRIDLDKDTFQAAGNGYSLSCTQVSEVGLVASFTADEKDDHDVDPVFWGYGTNLAVNRPTDMLMCGIISGAKRLVDMDFHCTDDSKKSDVCKVVLDKIDTRGWLRERLQPDDMANDDHVHVTEYFGKGKTYNEHILPGWESSSSACPFASEPGFQALYEYVEQNQAIGGGLGREIFVQMTELRRWIRLEKAVPSGVSMYCQNIYDRTTVWFLAHEYETVDFGVTWYVHLVAAHHYMSFRAWQATIRRLRSPTMPGNTETEPRTRSVEVGGKTFQWEGKNPPRDVELKVLMAMYLEDVFGGNGGLDEYFDATPVRKIPGRPLPIRDHKAAWLVMMLRGIAWSRSTRRLRDASSGEAVPSSCWDNPRPVWIT